MTNNRVTSCIVGTAMAREGHEKFKRPWSQTASWTSCKTINDPHLRPRLAAGLDLDEKPISHVSLTSFAPSSPFLLPRCPPRGMQLSFGAALCGQLAKLDVVDLI